MVFENNARASENRGPRHSLVRVVDAVTLKEARTIPVEGQPFTIVAVGSSGTSQ